MASRFGVDLYVLGGEESSGRRVYDNRNEYFEKLSSTWSFLDASEYLGGSYRVEH